MKHLSLLFVLILGGCSTSVKTPIPLSPREPASGSALPGISKGISEGLYKGPIALPTNDSKRKDAKLYLPLQYDSQDKWPLVVLLHGFTGTAEGEDAYLTTRFRVSTRGFILLTPEGTPTPNGVRGAEGEDLSGHQFWNATDTCCDFGRTGVDDVGYLSNLIEKVASTYKVDRNRIYVFGHSNGGFMANRLACEIGDRLAGVASLAGGTFKNPADCKNQARVSYLQIHAVDDPRITYHEDPNYAGGKPTVDQWLKRNGCTGKGKADGKKDYVFLVPFKPPFDETSRQKWTCQNNTQVSLWTLKAVKQPHYNSHVPVFNPNFTGDVLDFLFAQTKN